MRSVLRRTALCLVSVALLLLTSCKMPEWQDLRIFCDGYSETEGKSLSPEDFTGNAGEDGGLILETVLSGDLLMRITTLNNNRIHTVSLTALAETPAAVFDEAARRILAAYAHLASFDAAEILKELRANGKPGFRSWDNGKYKATYAENEAARYIRISQLRYLPEENPLPSLRVEE
ncbi:MAG: hypothetical protein LBR73_03025 [Oscillospiraceae bacterium]|nr:hypothetical protein [Oscillospiraceae bacterium]